MLKRFVFILFLMVFYGQGLAQGISLSDINKINRLPDSIFLKRSKNIYFNNISIKSDTASVSFYLRLSRLLYFSENNLAEAITLAQKSIQILKSLKGNNVLLSKGYYYLGYFFSEGKKFEDAIVAFQNVLTTEKDRIQTILTLHALSSLYQQIGDFQKAIEISNLGLELSKNRNEYKSYFINNLILSYNDLGLFYKALKIANKYPKNYSVSIANNKANSFEGLKKYEESRKIYKEVSKLHLKEKKYFELVSYPLNNTIYTYIKEQNYQKALSFIFKADKICKNKLPNIREETIARLYKNQGFTYFKLKKYRLSLSSYQKALLKFPFNYSDTNSLNQLPSFLLRTVGNKPYLLSILEAKGLVLTEIYLENRQVNYAKSALNHYLQADSLINQMRQEHTEQGTKLYWREKTHSFYENAIETCFRLNNSEKAFYFMEKSRTILLLDALKDVDARKILSAEKQAAEQELRYKIIGLQNKLASLPVNDKSYQATLQNLLNTKEKYNDFIKSIEKTNLAYYNLKYNNKYITLSEVQKKLKANSQALVEYFVGDSSVYAIAISANKVDFKKINLNEYKLLANKYLGLISLKPPHTQTQLSDLQHIAYRLNLLLFAPFNLPNGRVVISHDNYFLPFNSLVFNLENPTFLLENYAFSYTYSANILFREQTTTNISFKKLIGFAPINYQKWLHLNSLIGTDEALDKIEKQYFSGKTFLKETATKSNFIKYAADYKIIQLFTHGKADSTDAGSVIYFQDQPMKTNELYQLEKLKAELVVLTACETTLGRNAVGEGIMSFARGFAYLGVYSTISTLWSVTNYATNDITIAFYKFIA